MKFFDQQLFFAVALLFVSNEILAQNVEIHWLDGLTDESARVITANEGDVLNFTWQGFHNVFVLPTKEAFDACDFSEGQQLGNQSPTTYTVTGEITYFASSLMNNCKEGLKLEAIVSSDNNSGVQEEDNTIIGLSVATDELSTLTELVTAAGLVDTLNGEGPFTVFAPTNAAFANLPADVLASLTGPDNIDALVNALTCHVVGDAAILSANLERGNILTAMNGDSLTVTSLNPYTINEAVVVYADIMASNGVVHMIDTVLVPPESVGEEANAQLDSEISWLGGSTVSDWLASLFPGSGGVMDTVPLPGMDDQEGDSSIVDTASSIVDTASSIVDTASSTASSIVDTASSIVDTASSIVDTANATESVGGEANEQPNSGLSWLGGSTVSDWLSSLLDGV